MKNSRLGKVRKKRKANRSRLILKTTDRNGAGERERRKQLREEEESIAVSFVDKRPQNKVGFEN